MKPRIKNILIGFDQLTWVLVTAGAGSPDETVSAAMWRYEQDGRRWAAVMRRVIDGMFRLIGDQDHCQESYVSELLRSQLPDEYRRETAH